MKVTTDACLFGSWVPVPDQGQFLDIGAGTALLTLMLAQRSHLGTIDAVEFDEDTFRQGKENVEASPWKNRVRMIQEDIRNFYPDHQYDFVICNPPFFQNHLKSIDAQKNTARHSDHLSMEELIKAAKRLLKKSAGKLAVLFPFKQSQELIRIAEDAELFLIRKLSIRDQPGKEVIRCMMVFSGYMSDGSHTETFSIKDDSGQYTVPFIALLKDFYLQL